ncbi:MAG: hypothetical protein J7L94_03545 [Caldisericaceae bacterium]|nr:hypothetical protein [Caldisericaceae bacterium]
MQLSLFSVENKSKELYRKNLAAFNLQKAISELKLWHRSVDAPENLELKMQAVQFILDNLTLQPQNNLLFLAHLYQNAHQVKEVEPLLEDWRFLKKGLTRALADLLIKNEQFDFISEDLSPAEIFLLNSQFEETVRVVEKYVSSFGENAYLRQLQAAAYFKLNDEKQSRICYTLALFNDPRRCRPEYFWPRAFKNKMLYLQNKFPDAQQALLHMTFSLWEDGHLYLEPENTTFKAFIQEKIAAAAGKHLAAEESFLLFLHYLYLAEVERLSNFSKEPTPDLKALRQKMQSINKGWYQRYETRLLKFHML